MEGDLYFGDLFASFSCAVPWLCHNEAAAAALFVVGFLVSAVLSIT